LMYFIDSVWLLHVFRNAIAVTLSYMGGDVRQ